MKGGIFQTERVTISRWVMNECAFKENFVFLFSFEKEQNFHARKKDGGREVKMCLSFSRWTAVGWLAGMDEGFEVKTTTTRHAGENDVSLLDPDASISFNLLLLLLSFSLCR